MDPNEALARIRRMVDQIIAQPSTATSDDAIALAEVVEGLDHWIARGGFLPEAWAKR